MGCPIEYRDPTIPGHLPTVNNLIDSTGPARSSRSTRPIQPDTITGLILAGGSNRRFHGNDKGLIDFNGEPMAARVAGVLRGQVKCLMISANRNHLQYSAYADQVINDWIGNQWGPLAGVYTGLLHCQTDWLLVATCDQPLLPTNYANQFIRHCDGITMLVAEDPTRQHPLNI